IQLPSQKSQQATSRTLLLDRLTPLQLQPLQYYQHRQLLPEPSLMLENGIYHLQIFYLDFWRTLILKNNALIQFVKKLNEVLKIVPSQQVKSIKVLPTPNHSYNPIFQLINPCHTLLHYYLYTLSL